MTYTSSVMQRSSFRRPTSRRCATKNEQSSISNSEDRTRFPLGVRHASCQLIIDRMIGPVPSPNSCSPKVGDHKGKQGEDRSDDDKDDDLAASLGFRSSAFLRKLHEVAAEASLSRRARAVASQHVKRSLSIRN